MKCVDFYVKRAVRRTFCMIVWFFPYIDGPHAACCCTCVCLPAVTQPLKSSAFLRSLTVFQSPKNSDDFTLNIWDLTNQLPYGQSIFRGDIVRSLICCYYYYSLEQRSLLQFLKFFYRLILISGLQL